MMNIFLILGSILANVVAIVTVYQFIKRLDKRQIIIFIAISVTVMYLLISFVYGLSGIGIDENVHQNMKNFVTYLFVPINVILFIPYFARQYTKVKENELAPEKFVKKLGILVLLLIVVLIIEFFYFKSIQTDVKNIASTQNTVNNEMTSEIESSNINNGNKNVINDVNQKMINITITNQVN